jgi:3D (Asp-Asp-Asp) domain-containing protein
LKKIAARVFRGVFQNPKLVIIRIVLTVIICGSVRIGDAVYAGGGGAITVLSTTAIEPNSTVEQSDEWQTVRMRVTAYCPCPLCCGEYSDGQTACGHEIVPGDVFVAADKKYSFGTEMLVAGYNGGKPVKVLDRGGAIRGDRLDVFFASHQEALEWGVRYLDVKIRLRPQTQ